MRNTESLIIKEGKINKIYVYRVNKAGQALIKNLSTGVKEMIQVDEIKIPSEDLKIRLSIFSGFEDWMADDDEPNWKVVPIVRDETDYKTVAENLNIDIDSVENLSNKEYANGLFDAIDDTEAVAFFVNDYTEYVVSWC